MLDRPYFLSSIISLAKDKVLFTGREGDSMFFETCSLYITPVKKVAFRQDWFVLTHQTNLYQDLIYHIQYLRPERFNLMVFTKDLELVAQHSLDTQFIKFNR